MVITDLPPFILKQIFFYITKPHHLGDCARVCKVLSTTAYEMFVEVDLSEYGTAASQRTIQALIEHTANYLQVLDLSGCRNVTDATLNALSNCTRLQKLTLSWVDMKTTEAGLENIYKCNSLTSLSISNPEWSFPDIAFPRVLGAQGFEYISRCTNLTELSICGPPCSRLTIQSFLYLLQCTKLKNLHMDSRKANCNFLITDEILEYIHMFPNLDTLSFSGLSKDVTAAGLSNLGKLTNLTSLSLQYQWGMGVTLKFLEDCTSLRELNLDFPLLKSEEFEQFNVFCSPTLMNLELTHGTYLLNRHLPQLGWFSLRSLSLCSAVNITDDGLKFLGEYCKTLQSLELVGCHNICGEGLFHLSLCTELSTLKLRQCRNIGEASFTWLPYITTLQTLVVDGLSKITDTSLGYLLDCVILRQLSLKSCNFITLNGVFRLTQNSTTLKNVHIADCKGIVGNKDWRQIRPPIVPPMSRSPQTRHRVVPASLVPPKLTIMLNKTETVLFDAQLSLMLQQPTLQG